MSKFMELESTTQQGASTQLTISDYFNYHLNDHCLSEIFKYLSIKQRLDIAKVCNGERWRDASQLAWEDIKALNFQTPSPWQNDTEELPPAYRTNEGIARILQNCGRFLRELELRDPADSNILRVLTQHCCNLTKLDVDVSSCDTNIAELISSLQNLEYLRIRGDIEHYSVDFLEALPSATLAEFHLIVNDAGPLDPFTMVLPRKASKILKDLTKLTALSLEGFFITFNILKVISEKTQLTSLSLVNSSAKTALSPLTQLTNLQYLNLWSSRPVNDDLVMEISRNCKKLRYLNLNCCRDITDSGIESLADLPELEALDLWFHRGIRGSTLGELYNLRHLDVRDCEHVCNDGIVELLENAPYLEYLNVAHTNVTEKVLKTGGRITKNSIDEYPLDVIVSRSLKYNWQSRAAKFPLLVVDVLEYERDGYNRFYARRLKKRQERQRRGGKHLKKNC